MLDKGQGNLILLNLVCEELQVVVIFGLDKGTRVDRLVGWLEGFLGQI